LVFAGLFVGLLLGLFGGIGLAIRERRRENEISSSAVFSLSNPNSEI
jgi:hypothetical protein